MNDLNFSNNEYPAVYLLIELIVSEHPSLKGAVPINSLPLGTG